MIREYIHLMMLNSLTQVRHQQIQSYKQLRIKELPWKQLILFQNAWLVSTEQTKQHTILEKQELLFYDQNIKECYKIMDIISADIDKNFNYVKKYPKSIEKHRGDKTGKSIYTEITYKLKDGYIVITCYDYSIEDGGQDHLAVSIDTNELNEFLVSGVY